MHFEFLISKRPVSVQAKSLGKQIWKQFVRDEALKTWRGEPYTGKNIRLTLVYLYDTDPADVDNIIKPIQDALVGLVYADDTSITDVDAHLRSLLEPFDLTRFPSELLRGIDSGKECVYVRVCDAEALEKYL